MKTFLTQISAIFVAISVISVAPTFAAGDRVALVLGAASYKSLPPLRNTVNDAIAIASTLEGMGFEVETLINTPLDQVREALNIFTFRAETADLALIYFAGHGVEVEGENFLVPIDAVAETNADLFRQAISLKELLRAVESARQMRIIILDSCRDNPLDGSLVHANSTSMGQSQSSQDGGLAVPSPERGTMVAFAAKDGHVALDGTGENSPYAKALMRHLPTSGLDISLVFRRVRDEVLRTTGNRQEPHTYGSLPGIPYFLAGPANNERAPDLKQREEAWSSIRPDQELQLAALAQEGNTRSILGLAYMRLNPSSDRFDPDEGADLLSRAAEAGSPEAQFELAQLFETGVGVERSETRALALYLEAADQNFPDAINDLGFFYFQGALGLPRDPQKGLAMFERAANLRHPQAMFNFAALIDDGLVPGKTSEDAARYLYQALRSGSEIVMQTLLDSPLMFKEPTRRALQDELRRNTLYEGAIDGDIGPQSQRSIRRAYGLED